jgi:RNA polymerase sigma factor (sigma-70 family)
MVMAALVSDRELWTRGAHGDGEAFGELFERHADAIYNYVFRRTADWATAEDLTSVVFLEAWRRRAEVRLERESALPWLYGVATNVIRNERRARRRHRTALEQLPTELALRDDADEVDRALDQLVMREALALVAQLPRKQQDVLALCVWCDLSYEAAALALGLPVGTVRSRLSRARLRLAELSTAGGHEQSKSNTNMRVA